MFRLFVQWRVVIVAAVALTMIASPNVGVQAQDLGAVATPGPVVTTPAIVTDTSTPTATTAAPSGVTEPETEPVTKAVTEPVTKAVTEPVTKAVTEPATKAVTPEAEKAATTPVVTEAVITTTPTSTSVTADTSTPVAPIAAPVSNDDSKTTSPPPAATSISSESSATILSESTSSYSSIRDNEFESNLRGSEVDSSGDGRTASSSSLSASSNSVAEPIAGILNGSFSTTTIVLLMLGGIGLTIIMSLLFVLWRNRSRKEPDLETPISPNTTTTTFPAVSMPSIVAPTARDLSFWKASESSFTSRDLPLTANARTKLNAITRSSTGYDKANRNSHVAVHGPLTQVPQAIRETNASSEQSFSIREYSEFSLHQAVDLETETPVMTNEGDSASDGYSTGDRYSASGKYSASSRLSSDPGRSSSVWSQLQASKNLDIHRYSSTPPTASSVASRSASFVNHSTDTPVTMDSTTSRTDVPNWYNVIDSPTDVGRYTTSSLGSNSTSYGRESFEL